MMRSYPLKMKSNRRKKSTRLFNNNMMNSNQK